VLRRQGAHFTRSRKGWLVAVLVLAAAALAGIRDRWTGGETRVLLSVTTTAVPRSTTTSVAPTDAPTTTTADTRPAAVAGTTATSGRPTKVTPVKPATGATAAETTTTRPSRIRLTSPGADDEPNEDEDDEPEEIDPDDTRPHIGRD
jgi:hypothetical protein